MVHVKICCITTQQEAEAAQRHGSDAIGLVSWMPSGEGPISDRQIRQIAASNPDISRFLLTCKTDPGDIRRQVLDAGTDTVQLVDAITVDGLRQLRRELPDVSLVQVIHVSGPSAIQQAREVARHVDFLLLDSGNPNAANRTLGGTGDVHDWALSSRIVQEVACPVYLAGGLGPDNVAEAIARVRPYGVDVCSRLRPNGHLDEGLLEGFMHAVRNAPASGTVQCG